MTRMTGPDCAVMCNLIKTHTQTLNYKLKRRLSDVLPSHRQKSHQKRHIKYFYLSMYIDLYAAQDEGEWRRTAEQGMEHFMAK